MRAGVCLSKLFTHSLGQKLCQPVLCGNVCFDKKRNTVLVFNELKNEIVGTDVKLPRKKCGLSVQKWTSDYVLSARANLVPLVMLS